MSAKAQGTSQAPDCHSNLPLYGVENMMFETLRRRDDGVRHVGDVFEAPCYAPGKSPCDHTESSYTCSPSNRSTAWFDDRSTHGTIFGAQSAQSHRPCSRTNDEARYSIHRDGT